MIKCLPAPILRQLNGSEKSILDILTDLCELQVKKGVSGASYCYPSETWLASRIGRTRETASKCVSKLSRMGLIYVIHRRKYKGHWQTNLYKFGIELIRILKGLRVAVAELVHRVKFSSHIVNKTTDSKENQLTKVLLRNHTRRKTGDISDYLVRLGQKFGFEYKQ